MLPKINPTTTQAWQLLQKHFEEQKNIPLIERFKSEAHRFEDFSLQWENFLFDFSKNHWNKETVNLLKALFEECGWKAALESQFAGEKINETEDRAVFHTGLRNVFAEKSILIEGENVQPDILESLELLGTFTDQVRTGQWLGTTGKRIKYIVNIGIGGSDLGPLMAVEALKAYAHPDLECLFVSNVDGAHLYETLKKIQADETLFIIASKTFTTQETMANAEYAKAWFLQHCEGGNIAQHFVALSTNQAKAQEFGIAAENIFGFWDWVGGRYSVWGPIGLSLMLSIGKEAFKEFLHGAHLVDTHVQEAPFEKNIPAWMAALGIWYVNFWGAETEAILPYDQYLHRFAAYFQQGNMESNGKNTDRNGQKVNYATGPIIWGEPGTNGQHAFYQLIHQGTRMIPCDFLAAKEPAVPMAEHHKKLLSNFIAQTEALMIGKTLEQAHQELLNKGMDEAKALKIAPYRVFEGNKPSTSIVYPIMSPKTLGILIALYEHKIFLQGVVWNIYSYDQWGVELGKELANKILPEIEGKKEIAGHDASTLGLLTFVTQ